MEKVLENGKIVYKYALGEGPTKRNDDPFDAITKSFWPRSEVAKMLHVPYSTLNTWEKFFNVDIKRFERSAYYTADQVSLFHHIKRLMVDEKYTVEGAKIQLRKAKLI